MSAPGASAVLQAAGQRGRTTIADRALARMAERAVTEVRQSGGATRELTGSAAGRPAVAGTAHASARINGPLAMIEVRLSLAYPVPLRALTREVRSHVTERVAGLTGLEVRQVDIEVTRLRLPGEG